MKIAITGSTGQLGSDVVEVVSQSDGVEAIALSHDDIEVCSHDSVKAALTQCKPDAVINCAAFHQVDACEEKPEVAFRVNALGAWNVARVCDQIGAYCVYISTDYVFDGKKGGPYVEDDTPNPLNVYGVTKLAGEHLTFSACSQSLVARVASVIGKSGARGKGGNFIEAILKKAKAGGPLKVVGDTRMTPTYTIDAARTLIKIVQKKPTGVVHLTNQGPCSWHAFAKKAVELCGLSVEVAEVNSDAFPSKVQRPVDSSLSGQRLTEILGQPMRPWQEALHDYLVEKSHM